MKNKKLRKLTNRRAHFKDDIIATSLVIIILLIYFYTPFPCAKFGLHNLKDKRITAGDPKAQALQSYYGFSSNTPGPIQTHLYRELNLVGNSFNIFTVFLKSLCQK